MKKMKFREWQKAKASPEEEVKLKEYVKARKEAKKAVAKAQQKERERFGERLDTKEGQRSVYRIVSKWQVKGDTVDMKCLNNESGEVLIEADAVKERWREYMERLLNIENDWDGVLKRRQS